MKIRFSAVVGFVVAVLAVVSSAPAVAGEFGTPDSNWSNYGTWGYCYTATYGQTFTGNNEPLTGLRYRVYSESCCSSWPMRVSVYRWDVAQARAVGPELARSDTSYGGGCCWYDRNVDFTQRPVLYSDSTYVVVLTVTPWWNQYGCPTVSIAVHDNNQYASGGMYVLSNGGDAGAMFNQAWGFSGYDLNFTIRTTSDCDSNGIADTAELSAATDCNADQVHDSCQQLAPGVTVRASKPEGPIGSTATASFEFVDIIAPAGDVTMQINASADLSATHEFLFVRVGTNFERLIFTGVEQDCTTVSANVTVPRADFEAATVNNTIRVSIAGSPTVDAAACNGQSWATASFSYANQWPDCNGNLVGDIQDFCNGTSADCNNNFNPDECDIASTASRDLDGNSQPDECQIDCNNDQRPDAWQIAIGETPDCNANSIPDSCDLATQQSQDCNSNGVPDTCDITAGTSPDCDGDGKIDSCALAQQTVPDCNANGIPDACDMSTGTSPDCNANGKPDSCDLSDAQVTITTPQQSPWYDSAPLEYTIAAPRLSQSDIRLDIQFYGYSAVYYGYYFRPKIDGQEYGSWNDSYWGGCSSGVRTVYVPRDAWNAAAADGSIVLQVRQDTGNNCGGYCSVVLTYTPQPIALDCNTNGIPDTCDFASGVEHDCNDNGVPDSCDIAAGDEDKSGNGYPDQCDLDRGDLNLDGQIDGFDLGSILALWGGINYPIGDLNHDGIIDGEDLGRILSNWGPTF